MKRILLTGLAGTGKSTTIEALARRGYKAIDLDCDAYSHWIAVVNDTAPGTPVEADRDWVWREDAVAALLAVEDAPALFVSGTAANMGPFLPEFDTIILLSAPFDVVLDRLRSRRTNRYGSTAAQQARERELRDSVEPLLRRAADHEIVTTLPLAAVVDRVLELAGGGVA